MSKRRTFLLLLLVIITACSKRVDVPAPNEIDATHIINNVGLTTPQVQYRQVQLDFSGHSTEGGFILAYYDDANALQKIDVYLLSERGKVVLSYDLTAGRMVEVIRTEYQYEQSISETEGDVKISSHKETKYTIEDQARIIPDDKKTLDVFQSALKVVSQNGK